MKKRKILSIIGLGGLFILGLSSCGKKDNQSGGASYKDNENYDKIVANYFEAVKINNEVDKDSKDSLGSKEVESIDEDSYSYYTYITNDIYGVQNEKGYVGIYSVAENKFLVKPRFNPSFINEMTYTTVSKSNVTFRIIKINYGLKYSYYDEFGNELAKDSIDELTFTFEKTVNGVHYLKQLNAQTGEYKYLEYKPSENGKVNVLTELPLDKNTKTYKKDDQYFGNAIPTKIGDKDYYVKTNTANNKICVKVYDETYNIVKEFEVASGNSIKYTNFSNGNMFIQVINELPIDAAEYTYSSGISKYKVFTYKVNILDEGTVQEISFDKILNGADALVDKDKNVQYVEVTLRDITSDKVLGETNYYIMNENYEIGNKHEYKITNLTETENGYYYNTTGFLFNDKLEEITFVSSTYVKEVDGFLVSNNGYYGFISSNGKVNIPFEYKAINLNNSIDKKVYATNKLGVTGILDLSNGSFTSLKGYTYDYYGSIDIYSKYDEATDKTTIVTLSGSVTLNGKFNVANSVFKTNLFAKKIVVTQTNPTSPDDVKNYVITLNDAQFKENGTEETADIETYDSIDKAKELEFKEYNDLQILGNGSYYKFTFESAGKLTITSKKKLSNSFYFYNSDGDLIATKLATPTETKDADGRPIYKYEIAIDEAATNIIKLSTNANTYLTNVTFAFEANAEEA